MNSTKSSISQLKCILYFCKIIPDFPYRCPLLHVDTTIPSQKYTGYVLWTFISKPCPLAFQFDCEQPFVSICESRESSRCFSTASSCHVARRISNVIFGWGTACVWISTSSDRAINGQIPYHLRAAIRF